MSAQTKLLRIAMGLTPGQAYAGIPGALVADASIGDLPLLDRMGGARREDIDALVAKLDRNWGVRLTENIGRGTWTMDARVAPTVEGVL